jgi:hypothetical protein
MAMTQSWHSPSKCQCLMPRPSYYRCLRNRLRAPKELSLYWSACLMVRRYKGALTVKAIRFKG